MFSSEIFQNDFHENFKSKVLVDLIKFPAVTLKTIIIGMNPRLWFPGRKKIVFFYQTENNFNSIKSIQKITENSILLHTIPSFRTKAYIFPTGIAYIISFFFIPLALYHLVISKGKYRAAFHAFFNSFVKTYGLIVSYEIYLRLLNPKAIVLTNDHSRDPLIISSISKKLGIPLFFIPHGSYTGETVKENPMHFNYALVAGENQRNTIKRALPDANVYLIGRPSSDFSLHKYNRSKNIANIGICVNQMDKLGDVEKLIDLVNSKTDLEIVLRPHPAIQNSRDIRKFLSSKKLKCSNALDESPIDFLEKVDGIIAGCSGIIFDAAEMNVFPIFYDSSHRYKDFNNFVKNGLAEFVDSHENCIKLLIKLSIRKPNVRKNARYYNGTIGTKYDGKSSELARDTILKILYGRRR